MTASVGSSRIGRHASSTITTSGLGMVTSVLLDAIVIGFFGMGWQTDAYFIALTIPTVITTIMAIQAARVIQPMFIRKRETEGEKSGWEFLNLVMTNGIAAVAVISLIGAGLSTLIIRAQSAGSHEGLVALSSRISAFVLLTLPFTFVVSVSRIGLNSLGSFALPGATKFFDNVSKIIFVIILGRYVGVMALVVGTLGGALCQCLCYYLALRRYGYRFTPAFYPFHPDVRSSCRLMSFPLVGQLCTVGVELFNNAVGSMLGPGKVSALRLATRIIESFGGLFAGSIVNAAMPAVASHVSRGDREGAKESLRQTLYILLLVATPLSIWLAFVHRPLIAIIYQRVSFSEADAVFVSSVLLALIPYIFLGRLLGLMELPFFAEHDTKTPLAGSVTQAALYVTIGLVSVRFLNIYSLPLASSLSYLLASLVLMSILHRRFGTLGYSRLCLPVLKIAAATLVMALFAMAAGWLVGAVPLQGFISRIFNFGIPTLASGTGLLTGLILVRIIDPLVIKRMILPLNNYPLKVLAIVRCSRKTQ